ncbi:hypothetical protein AQ490_09590 [Wenjunlia vitaminophila]|uniref:Uncharacterized protein n=1 Tax=Wenjunlia vitaminophila TaxID=76728 RepID=A0A0T6LM80_WENVI|nr:hypothetical protein [Wenjunlia vitaminophila]KRV47001.1 hypothetical protein AQ490_09590 [Wenjunlia vitaminophila]
MTSADLILPVPEGQAPAAVVLHRPDDRAATERSHPLDEQLTRVSAALDSFGYLVALVPATLPAQERRRLHTVRAVLESDRIALVDVDLPPLAAALLARQLTLLCGTDLAPGVLAGAARLLPYYLHTGAVLNSIARLDRVEVNLRSHLRSWVPGSQFAVVANPQAHLAELTGSARLPGPDFATHLAVGEHGLASDWVSGDLARQWRCQRVCQVPLPAASTQWWGNQKLVEFAAYIPDVAVLHQLVRSVRRDACGWCGLETIGDRCLFCSARVEPTAPTRPAAVTPGSAATPAGTSRRPGPGAGAGTVSRTETDSRYQIGPTRR